MSKCIKDLIKNLNLVIGCPKMQKKPMPLAFMLCAFAAMLLINIFSVRISSIILMFTCGLISLVIFMVKKPAAKGGAGK